MYNPYFIFYSFKLNCLKSMKKSIYYRRMQQSPVGKKQCGRQYVAYYELTKNSPSSMILL